MTPRTDAAISPTAHYTGYVWARNGLAPPAYATLAGRLMYHAVRPANGASHLLGGPSLEGLLLARHRCIDALLRAAIEAGQVRQVIEVAAGLSPRGWRFMHDYTDSLTYIETDLPDMAAAKRRLLHRAGSNYPGHQVREMNANADHGADSLAAIADTLDPDVGLAIITEGLLNYFDQASVRGMWSRFARALNGFANGLYLSDLHVASDNANPLVRSAMPALSAFVRGQVHLHFADPMQAQSQLRAAGFEQAELHTPADLITDINEPGARMVRIVHARTSSAATGA